MSENNIEGGITLEVLRVREFDMKDSYSIDFDDAGLDKSFNLHHQAYERIFTRLGLHAIPVEAAAFHLAVATLLNTGDHIVSSQNLYGGSHNMMTFTMPRFGISTTFVDPHEPQSFLDGTEVIFTDQFFAPLITAAREELGDEDPIRHVVLIGEGDVQHDLKYE